MRLYSGRSYEEVSEEVIEQGLQDGTIEIKVVKPAITSEEIYNQLKADGEEVAIKNGVYCRVKYGTYEAINPINAQIKYVVKK